MIATLLAALIVLMVIGRMTRPHGEKWREMMGLIDPPYDEDEIR